MFEEEFDEHDENAALVYRADAYISRRKGMLPQGMLPPQLTQPIVIHTQQPDLPTLETPAASEAPYLAATAQIEGIDGVDEVVLTRLVNEVSRAMSRHLIRELPELLYNSTLSTLEADLRQGIFAATEVAARNFIAQRLHRGTRSTPKR